MRIHPITRSLAAALICALPALPAMAARFELQGGVSYMGNPSNNYSTPVAFDRIPRLVEWDSGLEPGVIAFGSAGRGP